MSSGRHSRWDAPAPDGTADQRSCASPGNYPATGLRCDLMCPVGRCFDGHPTGGYPLSCRIHMGGAWHRGAHRQLDQWRHNAIPVMAEDSVPFQTDHMMYKSCPFPDLH
ncbi:hypothetical protein PSTG_07102 [Puccinia striiformis f. sp. tritici PST-78]|uniref:Uncharacterized protein n=1 Tax=Puccinia striiformis f. sp. tritici PST-78 TaxID=1165861 RepID=A0A0L0VKT6_9BASI|nr:hypothetical protein PSTG_07102 [Puccinia striiformis f. sp. tritici PST-78]